MDKKKKGYSQKSKKYLKTKSNLSSEITPQICDCEATKHPLVNNCINCGRIVCLSEGPGPCFFCGFIVCYNDESELYPKDQIDHFDQKNKSQIGPSENVKLRDKLLDFDKNCASQTNVIDDECDYYQSNNIWLTKNQREEWEKLESQICADKSRWLQKRTLDITGRVHVERIDPLKLFNKMNSIQDDKYFNFNSTDSHFKSLEGPKYICNYQMPSNEPLRDLYAKYRINRIQDTGYLEISDDGVCLSMHQPYASLLVRGIKTTEGRTWYTSHRGRLWIASTVKDPKPEEVKLVEETYRLLSDKKIEFPKTYPTGCLIGCVTVTDVLPQEEYDKLYPDEKTNSPYIFVCDNFFELPMKYPIQGKHKIYKLESVIHRAVLNCLEKTCMQMSKNAHSLVF